MILLCNLKYAADIVDLRWARASDGNVQPWNPAGPLSSLDDLDAMTRRPPPSDRLVLPPPDTTLPAFVPIPTTASADPSAVRARETDRNKQNPEESQGSFVSPLPPSQGIRIVWCRALQLTKTASPPAHGRRIPCGVLVLCRAVLTVTPTLRSPSLERSQRRDLPYPSISHSMFPNRNRSSASASPEPPPPPRPRQKRSQVARACDWCRVHRIKCDNDHPCSNCKSRGGQCSNSGATKLATLPHAYREIERLRQKVQELEQELQKERNVEKQVHTMNTLPSPPLSNEYDPDSNHQSDCGGAPAKRVWEGIHMSTARSPQKTWYGSSSIFYFIGRINNFLASAFQQPHCMLPNSASKVLDAPTAVAGGDQTARVVALTDDPIKTGDYLTPSQEEYFLGLFWQSYYTSCPILDEQEFKDHYQSLWATSDKERKPSALVDIVIAICMQYGMALLPRVDHGLSAISRANVNNNDATIAGRWYYRRCQTLVSCELESPTISTLQCHILCSIYLCCGSFQNMADNACGLAVRTAYMLGLHMEPPQDLPRREREMRKRLWWTLYALESKMSMKLGRPFLLHESNTTCSLPADDREIAILSGSSFAPVGENVTWLTWNLHNTKLMLEVRIAYTAFYDKVPFNVYNGQTIWDDISTLGAYAELLGPHTERLEEWLRAVPAALKTKRQNNGGSFSTDRSALEIEQFAPLWLQRQRLLLELMYHNLCTNLYRPFITFAPATAPTPLTEKLAIKCAAHAMALTHIMHQVLSTTTILAGWHEAFQWQWNAAVSLVGFVLAYPQGASTPAARSAIDLSIAVFENFGNSFAVAASAANIIRDVSAKVDLCIDLCQGKQCVTLNPKEGPDEMQHLTSCKEPGDEGIINSMGSFPVLQDVGPLSFDDETAAKMQGVLSQSIDMTFTTDAYNEFDMLWLNMNSNFPDEWAFCTTANAGVFKGQESGVAIKSTTTKPDQLTGDSVYLKVTASGVCGTDMVLGHEGVGIVQAVGPEVTTLKEGDRVGWGYENDSCGHCIECLQGAETYCPDRALYGIANSDQGSFATHAIWRESFLFKIPDGLSDVDAAPLQCGGATTFTALYDIKPSDVVGIMGVGGLGHLGIQFAAKMGCRVVVLSGTDKKKEEAFRLGAHEFIATKGAKELKAQLPLNRLLVTTSAQPDWELILPILAPRASIYPLSVDSKNFEFPYMPLILQGISVVGSLVAPRNQHRQMLDFASLHKIKPIVEQFPMTEKGINDAMEKLERGEMYYRAVLIPE
ncbi:hypothetical protein B7494_g6257 [Chlorociboria aeruginascens]|nr:hypothetical protein B7494_g6257 [Chlorociboria aeruginascens]